VNYFLDNLLIFLFYGVSGLFISGYCYVGLRRIAVSLVVGMLIVFVSSEFWELPIIIGAYFGYGKPEMLNHAIILLEAFILVAITRVKLTKKNGVILLGNIGVNTVILALHLPTFTDWFLRFSSLISLAYIFILATWESAKIR
jgi:hypothetical protein